MRQALIFTLLSCTLISAAPAVAKETKERAQIARRPPFDWVLVDGDSNTMSGSTSDLKRAKALRQGDEPILFIRRGDRAWVIRDPAVLDRVRAAWAPCNAHGKKMEAVGKKMSAIGEKMSAIGDKMGVIGNRMGKVGAEMARLGRDDDARRERLQAEMNALQREMEPLQEQINAHQEEMQPHQDEMERLSPEMERLSDKAEEELVQIVDAAIAQGLAREVK